jgi:hypothetical protein
MRNRRNHGSLNFIVSITLFTVFALALTLVLLTGASAFRDVSESAQERFDERTPLLYISNRLADADRVFLSEVDGTPVLIVMDDVFAIYIYLYEGHIREFYSMSGGISELELGVETFAAESLTFARLSSSLLQVTIDGRSIYANVEVMYL